MPKRKMSVSALLVDVRKNISRKMTIHDPSTVATLVQSLTLQNPLLHHLSAEDLSTRRERASSVPPSFRSSDASDQFTEGSEDHHHRSGDTSDTDYSISDGEDEYLREYWKEQTGGDYQHVLINYF
ncbi:uncharacterized protein LOC121861352 [Homarus americanus]|uniref:uncharacterized protein LOC121861352 n=1 Tax=Homarus americanus TaxID=6706 RepID=UPI001C44D31C|nr:uncharacterized protein LOC121861352 [Homarus americanus]